MRDHQMNRVQRRLWRAFLVAGGEIKDRRAIERFQRLVEDHTNVLPPSLSRAMAWALACESEIDYDRLVATIATNEGARVSTAAARQRVSRAVRWLEAAIREAPWIQAPRLDRRAIVFRPAPIPRLGMTVPGSPPKSIQRTRAFTTPADAPSSRRGPR